MTRPKPDPPCTNASQHTPQPRAYVAWHVWAEQMGRTHTQHRCSGCGLYQIWARRPDAPDLPPIRPPQVSVMGEDGEWQEVGGVASFEFHIDTTEFDEQWQALHEQIVRIQVERVRQVQQVLEAVRQAFAAMAKPAAQAADNFRHLPEAIGCNDCGKPAPRRDRPAWQSPYGPPTRRR